MKDVTRPDETLSARIDSTDAPASDASPPPPPGSRLSPEEAHRLLTGTIRFAPGSIQSSGIPVGQDTPLAIGQDLQVKWGNTWWAGTILGLEPDGRVRIRYFGWAESYDEIKPRSELQLDTDARLRAIDRTYIREGRPANPIDVASNEGAPLPSLETVVSGDVLPSIQNDLRPEEGLSVDADSPDSLEPVPLFSLPSGNSLSPEDANRLLTGTILFNPGSIPSSEIPVQQHTPLSIGQDLQVKWGSTWWAGTILGFEPGGHVRIRYFGWADSYDEAKPRSELQLDPDARLRAINRTFALQER